MCVRGGEEVWLEDCNYIESLQRLGQVMKTEALFINEVRGRCEGRICDWGK